IAEPGTTLTCGAASAKSSGMPSGEVNRGMTGLPSVSWSISGLTEPSSPALSTDGNTTCEFKNALMTSTTSSLLVSPSVAIVGFSIRSVCSGNPVSCVIVLPQILVSSSHLLFNTGLTPSTLRVISARVRLLCSADRKNLDLTTRAASRISDVTSNGRVLQQQRWLTPRQGLLRPQRSPPTVLLRPVHLPQQSSPRCQQRPRRQKMPPKYPELPGPLGLPRIEARCA